MQFRSNKPLSHDPLQYMAHFYRVPAVKLFQPISLTDSANAYAAANFISFEK